MTEEATIRRGVRNARYTTVPNHVFEDVRLSMEARWLLGYLLSKPDNWTVILGDIASRGGCGRDKARRIINELVQHGYADKEQERDDGRFGKLSLVIFDEPRERRETVAEQGVASLPQTENPSTVNPSTVNPTLVNTDGLVTPENDLERECGREDLAETPIANAAAAADPRKLEVRVKRLAARLGWPGWANSSTAWTVARFAELSDAEQDESEAKAPAYLAHCGGKALSLGTYFQQRKWMDLPAAAIAAAEASPPLTAAPFGKMWGAMRLRWLLQPRGLLPRASAFLEGRMAEEGAVGERERLAYQARHGWPAVNHLHRMAADGAGIVVPMDALALEPIAATFEKVRVGSDEYRAWKALHEERGWPWLPDPGRQEWVYFPAGGPERLEAFEQALRGDHDAGGREAAE